MSWPIEHLTDAAAYWQDAGSRCYAAFDQIRRDSVSIDWQGEAAERLRSRTFADEAIVSGVREQLVMAVKVARIAATELYASRSRMQYAVEDAHAAGFVVGEDLSLTDQLVWSTAAEQAARRADAEALLADIDLRAGNWSAWTDRSQLVSPVPSPESPVSLSSTVGPSPRYARLTSALRFHNGRKSSRNLHPVAGVVIR
ncbi:hypothetical protein H7I94_21770 [Mycobacterium szulgai]|nr:hypothetical protein [Mycobacterium szulgai]